MAPGPTSDFHCGPGSAAAGASASSPSICRAPERPSVSRRRPAPGPPTSELLCARPWGLARVPCHCRALPLTVFSVLCLQDLAHPIDQPCWCHGTVPACASFLMQTLGYRSLLVLWDTEITALCCLHKSNAARFSNSFSLIPFSLLSRSEQNQFLISIYRAREQDGVSSVGAWILGLCLHTWALPGPMSLLFSGFLPHSLTLTTLTLVLLGENSVTQWSP